MKRFSVSFDALIRKLQDGQPFGLLSQQTSPLGEMLHERLPRAFKAVFSAEHGYFGLAAPGEKTDNTRHPRWRIPVFSLYGATRKPTPDIFARRDCEHPYAERILLSLVSGSFSRRMSSAVEANLSSGAS